MGPSRGCTWSRRTGRATLAPAVDARERLAFALDVPLLADAEPWIARLAEHVGVFKVGLELYTAAGPLAVRAVRDTGHKVFLDLKLHDIPATMARTARVIADQGVNYFTIHAAAGSEALEAVAHAIEGTQATALAVTLLTSLDERALAAVGLMGTSEEVVLRLGRLATDAGIGGLVCSPRECAALRRHLPKETRLVVPGIRPAGSAAGDQKRVATPRQAIADGADVLVVGRPIRDASDPRATAEQIVAEIEAGAR